MLNSLRFWQKKPAPDANLRVDELENLINELLRVQGDANKTLAQSLSALAKENANQRTEVMAKLYAMLQEIKSLTEVTLYIYKEPRAYRIEKNNKEDACWDVFVMEDTIIPGKTRGIVNTGLVIGLDAHWEVQVRSRSSTSANTAKPRRAPTGGVDTVEGAEVWTDEPFPKNLTVHLGTCDPGYRLAYGVIIENDNEDEILLRRGDKIAQLAVRLKPKKENVVYCDTKADIPATGTRGESGFGKSGSNAG
jgi:dUTPase